MHMPAEISESDFVSYRVGLGLKEKEECFLEQVGKCGGESGRMPDVFLYVGSDPKATVNAAVRSGSEADGPVPFLLPFLETDLLPESGGYSPSFFLEYQGQSRPDVPGSDPVLDPIPEPVFESYIGNQPLKELPCVGNSDVLTVKYGISLVTVMQADRILPFRKSERKPVFSVFLDETDAGEMGKEETLISVQEYG